MRGLTSAMHRASLEMARGALRSHAGREEPQQMGRVIHPLCSVYTSPCILFAERLLGWKAD